MLSEFQQEIITIVGGSTSDQRFALAGGAALIVKGLVDRNTRDLDFFASEPEAVGRVVESVDEALHAAGMTTRRLIEGTSFVRIEVSRDGEVCELDLGVDARIRPEEPTEFGPVVATEELAADKTLALFGRAAARDFVDVYILSRRFGEKALCTLAAEKDAGFDRGHLADALRSFHRLDRDLLMSTTRRTTGSTVGPRCGQTTSTSPRGSPESEGSAPVESAPPRRALTSPACDPPSPTPRSALPGRAPCRYG